MPHSERDTRKFRGSRTHGYGRIGQHRKAGQRGGKGRVGYHKGKWSWTVKFAPDYFGKHGFKRPPRIVPEINHLNIGEIENMLDLLLAQNIAIQEKDHTTIDLNKLGITKVLGNGNLSRPFTITAANFSKTAISKIEAAGGAAIVSKA
ncbi:MAG TPA: uL15 family ribosomal protein [Candidatus Deferrimicrobium sp.]|nr:uL15 family ribosomal protein [Candidatus Deferrimicrobium sp.]